MRGHLRILRLWACDVCAANTSFAAMTALAFFAVAFEASAQTSPPGYVLGLGPPAPLVLPTWVKLCSERTGPNARRMCRTTRDSRSESGELLANVAIVERDGEPRKFFYLSHSVALQHRMRLVVDQDQLPPWINCVPPTDVRNSHTALCEVAAALIERMKSGQVLTVQATRSDGWPISLQIDLNKFATAFDGPPTEFMEFARQQRIRPDEPQKPFRDDTLQPHLRPWN